MNRETCLLWNACQHADKINGLVILSIDNALNLWNSMDPIDKLRFDSQEFGELSVAFKLSEKEKGGAK
jgi:hypothetical protein